MFSLLCTNLFAINRNKWETHEIVLQSTVITLTTVDLMQTYTFLYKDPYRGNHKETNWAMGEFPSKERFFIVGTGWIVIHTGISHLLHYLPPKTSKILVPIWQCFFIAEEMGCIHHNFKAGIRIKY